MSNAEMLDREFWGPDGKKIDKPNQQIIDQFESITGIKERRYAEDDQVTSDLAALAAAMRSIPRASTARPSTPSSSPTTSATFPRARVTPTSCRRSPRG